MRCVKNEMLTAIIIVARVQPGTSKGITDLLLPQPSSGLKTSAVPLVYPSQRGKDTHQKAGRPEVENRGVTSGCGHVRCLRDCWRLKARRSTPPAP